jgi:hypothetical protein
MIFWRRLSMAPLAAELISWSFVDAAGTGGAASEVFVVSAATANRDEAANAKQFNLPATFDFERIVVVLIFHFHPIHPPRDKHMPHCPHRSAHTTADDAVRRNARISHITTSGADDWFGTADYDTVTVL